MNLNPATLWDRIKLKRDYQETFGTPHGKRVLAHILKVSGATAPKFTSNSEMLRWHEAQRHLALSIFRQVHSSLDKLPDLLAEELKRIESEQTDQTQ